MPYFDHNATTPFAPAAREAWLRATEESWQNPSSPYRAAARAKIRLDGAREQIARFLGCPPKQIVLTSGATEGANAVLAYWVQTLPRDARIAVNPTEHPCVLETAKRFFGERIVWLPVTRDGVVTLEAVSAQFSSGPKIGGVVVMAANNETGVLQPWREIAQLCRAQRVAFFCDAAQWLGKLPASGFGDVGWTIAAAHKFGGPKGVGFLKLPSDDEGFSIQIGGEQERGHRGGTENVPGAYAMAAALADAEQTKVFQETMRLRWREAFERDVKAAIPEVVIVAGNADRLWNTVSLLMPHGANHRWVAKLDQHGFQVSTGSACATGKEGPSHVLAALGYTPDEAKRVMRISSGWETTEEEWKSLVAALAAVERELRADAGDVVKL